MATTETTTLASDHTTPTTHDQQYVKQEKDEAIAEKILSLANDGDKPEDGQGEATSPSKTEGDEVKTELAAVVTEKPNDSPALEASVEDNLKHDKVEDAQNPAATTEEDEKKVEPDAVEKTEDNLKEEKEPIAVTESVHDEAESQQEEPPSTESTVKEKPKELDNEPVETTDEEKQPKSVDISEVSADTIEKSSNTVEANPQTEIEAVEVKEAAILESDLKEETPEVVETKVKEKTEEPEKESPEIESALKEEKHETVGTEVQEKTEEPVKESQEAEIFERDLKEEKPEPVGTEVQEKTDEPVKESQEAEILETDLKEEKPEPVGTEVQEKTEEPVKESQEAEILETDLKEEKPEPVGTEVQEKTVEPEKESQEAEQPRTVAIPEPSAEVNEKSSDIIQEKTTESSAEGLKETNNNDVEPQPTETVKAEPVVSEVDENKKEPEKQSNEGREEEKPNTSAVPEQPAETGNAIEEKTRELEFLAENLKENETVPTETEKAEAVVTNVDENQSEPEKQPVKEEEEKKPAETAEQPGDVVEVHPPKDSDIEVVKDTGNSESEAVHVTEEKTQPVSTEVQEKPKEQLQVGEEVEETKQEIVVETSKSEATLDDTIKDLISSKDEKTDKEGETSLTVDTAQVSSNGEAHTASTDLQEPSTEVAEKVVEEDGKKESSLTDVIEGESNDVAGIIKNTEKASTDEEAKTSLKEERELVVPAGVEEKVAVAVNDDKKESEAADVVPGSSREVEVETKTVEEQNEAKKDTTEGEGVKVESVKEDIPAVNHNKEGNADTKVDEISTAVTEHVRETLASKFEEKEDEEPIKTGEDNLEKEKIVEPVNTEVQATKEIDATNVSKDLPKETPAKPAQKQSNNIISKVKQSLVKAKKAITGKSPSSKNLSSEAKGDIKVK